MSKRNKPKMPLLIRSNITKDVNHEFHIRCLRFITTTTPRLQTASRRRQSAYSQRKQGTGNRRFLFLLYKVIVGQKEDDQER